MRPPLGGYHSSGLANYENGLTERTIADKVLSKSQQHKQQCRKCGAIRTDKQIGLEQSISEYIETMVTVFREVWRVLKLLGTCWVEIGDSYNVAGRIGHGTRDGNKQATNRASRNEVDNNRASDALLKPKDKALIPFRLAIALQDDGWYIRQDIIWHHVNCMPESVQDRTTNAHSYIFLLSKQPRYYYDAVAIQEPSSLNSHARGNGVNPKAANNPGPNSRMFVDRDPEHANRAIKQNRSFSAAVRSLVPMRNKRSVWAIPSEPLALNHFAAFPSEIPRLCISAGTSQAGVCSECGKPLVRVLEKNPITPITPGGKNGDMDPQFSGHRMMANTTARRQAGGHPDNPFPPKKTLGWQPSCSCNAPTRPAVVFDPFCGAATTLLVADRLGRDAIGLELNPDYCRMGRDRIASETPLFLTSAISRTEEKPAEQGDLFS